LAFAGDRRGAIPNPFSLHAINIPRFAGLG
jgi:hypothetical protein